jgi:hypothetical protein
MDNAGLYNHSFRALADKAGIGTTTVTGLVYGRRQSDEHTIQAVADALRLPVPTIRQWAATALGEAAPFELPAEANRLTKRERDAVLAVVRAMLDPVGQAEAGRSPGPEPTGQLVDFARPTLPNPAVDTIAAQRGESIGRRMRDEQDEDPGT